MQTVRTAAVIAFLAFVMARPANAHQVVWIDFVSFDLSRFPTVNGHAPTASDETAIENLVFAQMQEDFALFDIHLVRYQPTEGSYTRLRFRNTEHRDRETFGCASAACCNDTIEQWAFGRRVLYIPSPFCTGQASWTVPVSSAEVYAGTFARFPEFQGADATTARIARALANTGSQQLGSILGLTSCHAAGNFAASGSDPSVERTSCGSVSSLDAGRNYHIMASGSSTGLTREQLAERDLFFSVRSSRRTLYRLLQPRNHWQDLQSLDGNETADLLLHRFATPLDIEIISRPSTGRSFGPSNGTLSSSAGDRGDVFYATGGAVVRARPLNGSSVEWRALAPGGALPLLRSDAGNLGSIFRWASIRNTTTSGKQDLFFGRPSATSSLVEWWVNPLNPFQAELLTGSVVTTSSGAAAPKTLFAPAIAERSLIATNDRTSEDLLMVVRDGALMPVSRIVAYVSDRSLPGGRVAYDMLPDFSEIAADYVFFADLDGDRDDDLVIGKVRSDLVVQWSVFRNLDGPGATVPFFAASGSAADDRGEAGSHFRMGDVDGDGRADLIIGRPVGRAGLVANPSPDVVEWVVARSSGAGLTFGPEETWISDWGREGDFFP